MIHLVVVLLLLLLRGCGGGGGGGAQAAVVQTGVPPTQLSLGLLGEAEQRARPAAETAGSLQHGQGKLLHQVEEEKNRLNLGRMMCARTHAHARTRICMHIRTRLIYSVFFRPRQTLNLHCL